MRVLFDIAASFHCRGSWADRLAVAEGAGFRAPGADELAALAPAGPAPGQTARASLFAAPRHMLDRFWGMLADEAAAAGGDFDGFCAELREFLAFKGMPPPQDAVYELIVQDRRGEVRTDDAWSVINFGEDAVALAWPALRLRLLPGEGCRLGAAAAPAVVPPEGDALNVLVAVRGGSPAPT